MSQLNTQHLRHYPQKPAKVYLFSTCLVDGFFPESGLDAIHILEQQGIEVIYPQGQSCCGQPAYNSGYQEQAKAVALKQISYFPEDIPIIVLSGSCGGMMRHHYLDLLNDEPEINAFCDRIFEFTEFLIHVCRIQLEDTGPKERVAIHTSCAARREMGVHITSGQLIKKLSNVEVVVQDYESECCGFGGTFSVKHGDISAAMVADKTTNLKNAQVDRYVSADWGCMMNINGALDYQNASLKGEHIASYLKQRTQQKAK